MNFWIGGYQITSLDWDEGIARENQIHVHARLNNKIVGLTGDGVFAKGNAPFKSKIQELIDKTLVFRWDLLHMINRCHIDAKKGDVIDSLEDADEVGLDDDHIDNDSGTKDEVVGSLISELINYIQKEAKAFRHG